MLEILVEENVYGIVHPVEVAADAPISALLPGLVKELHLPRMNVGGGELTYRLRDPRDLQPLPEQKSLRSLGITPGTLLTLEPAAVESPATVLAAAAAPSPTGQMPQSPFHSDATLVDSDQFALPAAAGAADAQQGVISGKLGERPQRKRGRRAFLLLGGAVLGASSLGLGYAAYRTLQQNNLFSLFAQHPAAPMKMAAPTKQPTQPKPTQKPTSTLPTKAQMQFVFMQHQQTVRSLTWSPDGKLLASGANDAMLLIWDTQGHVQRRLGLGNIVRALAWSNDGAQIAVGAGTRVLLVNPQMGNPQPLQQRHTGTVTSVAWAPQGAPKLVSTGVDQRAIVWNGANMHQVLAIFRRHTSAIESASWSPDAQSIATSSTGGVTRVWNAFNAQEVHGYYMDTQTANRALAFAPQGMQLAVGGDDGVVRLWNGLTCQQQAQTIFGPRCTDAPHHLRGHTGAIQALAWSPDGRFLATGANDNQLIIWYPAQGNTPLLKVRHNAPVRALHWSPDGKRIASASGNNVTIWQLM